jgi:hypothetical protein
MVLNVGMTVGYGIAVVFGLATMLFGGRALSVLRRPPTGEAGRELVFLSAEDLVAPIGVTLFVLLIEWVEWIVMTLRGAGVVTLASFNFYANIVQGGLLFVAAIMLYRVFVPYTRSRRAQRSRMILDRLAARVALLRGRK